MSAVLKSKRVHRTFAQIEAILDDHDASALSIGAYCQQHGYPVSTFQQWRARRRQALGASVPHQSDGTTAKPAFSELRVRDGHALESRSVRIETPSGYCVEVPVSLTSTSDFISLLGLLR